MKSTRLVLLLSLMLISGAYAQQSRQQALKDTPVALNYESLQLMQDAADYSDSLHQGEAGKKSGIKAALFSAIIPGAGEVYAKSYWKAALFAGIEVALWSANIIYNNKGDSEDKKMKAFGDVHWDERVYWSNVYRNAVAQNEWGPNDPTVMVSTDDLGRELIEVDFYTPEVIAVLRQKESQVGFTHTLPSTKTQQYYEMIYKYLHQFGVGWDDVVTTYGDPYFYDNAVNLGKLTPNISSYRSMRNTSNGFYDTATTMVSLVMVNHLLSMFDAAYSVKRYNQKVHYSFRMRQQMYGYEPVYTYGVQIVW